MNNINGVNGYTGPQAIQPPTANGSNQARSAPKPSKGGDQVEISPIAKYLQKIATMPEIRTEKVAQIRQALNHGDYDVERHLDQAIDNFIQENTQE